jgi:hypothetical protein
MDSKKIGIAALVLLVAVTAWLVVSSMADGPQKTPAKAKPADEAGEGAGTAGKAERRPAAEGETAKNEPAKEEGPDLRLPGQLPTLKGVQAPGPEVKPAQPHGQFELEGDVQEADAEAAVKAVFPAIRDCYVELRQRAPQARGRMLMKFAVKPATEAGQTSLGELYLKETQFTDPKYLTCVRAAIDAAKFPTSKPLTGAVTVPLILSPEDAGDKPAQ